VAHFEVWSQEARVSAAVERIVARTRARTRALLAFHEGGKTLRVRFSYLVVRQSLFRLEPRLPAGWIPRQLLLDGQAVEHTYEKDGRLVLVFPTGLKPGAHTLDAILDTDEVDWVPSDGAARFELAALRSGLDEEMGWLAVATDPAFRVAAEATNGLLPIGMPELQSAGFAPSDRVVYAWRFEAPGYAARFRLERHAPQITATVMTRVAPSERLMGVHASLFLSIERTGVRELKVALPKGTGPLVEFTGPRIKEKRAPGKDADPETWTIVFQTRVRGAYRLDIVFERKFEEDAWSAEVPAVAVPDAQERGFLVIGSSPSTALTVERDGLREADVGELPEPPPGQPLEVLAYAAQPFRVAVSSRRHDPREVLQAIALSSHVYGVLSREGRLRCRAEYRVRNNDQPFLFFDLPPSSALLGVLVDGQPAKPLVEAGRLKLPLPRSKDRVAPFVVAMVYDTAVEEMGSSGEVVVERPRLDIDVLSTDYTLHLPRGFRVVGHEGDLVPLQEEETPTVLAALGELLPGGTRAAAGDPTAMEPLPGDGGGKGKKVGDRRRGRAGERSPDAGAATEKAKSGSELRREGEMDDLDSEARGAGAGEELLLESEKAVEEVERGLVAQNPQSPPTPAPGRPAAPARRPEKALLSLDIQFLQPDNVVRLRSLAPSGGVVLGYAGPDVFRREGYLGGVLGAAVGFLLLLRRKLLRVLAGASLLVVTFHFAGLSFLPAELARGAAYGIAAAFVLALLSRVRWPRRAAAAPLPLLLLAVAARADETVLVPYDPKHPEKIERVFLGSEEYHRLRSLAYPDEAARATVFSSASYEARLSGAELTLLARYEIVKETEEAERIELRFDDVAVAGATVDGRPATLAVEKGGYVLVLTGKGRRALEVTLRPRMADDAFAVPVRPVLGATLTVVHDRPNHEVSVVALGRSEGEVHHLGPVGTLSAAFRPRTEGFRAPEA
ncbi:MAG: hypothetical protein ACREID_07000, partial [Planctomycetota bacterium]